MCHRNRAALLCFSDDHYPNHANGHRPASSATPVNETGQVHRDKLRHQPGQPGALLRRIELAGGHLELVQWGPPPTAPSPATGPAPSPRLLRVWLPPGYYDGPVAGTTQADLAAEDTPAATSTAITGPPPPSTLAPTPPAAGLLPAPAPATPPPGGWPVLYLNALFGILEPSCTPAAYQLLQAESPEACHLLLLNGDTTVLQMARNVEMFDDRLSFSGHSWRVAQTASKLISSGVLPGFVVVGLDHAGARRSAEYTPVKPGTGPGGHRQDAAAWPGGEVDAYLDTVVQQVGCATPTTLHQLQLGPAVHTKRCSTDVMPWAQQTYRVTNQAAKVAFGGSSFGAICTLCLCLRYPGLVGSTLIESPSCWIDEGRWFKEVLLKHRGPWPAKVWLAMGEAEHRRDPEAPLSRLLVGYATQLSQHLRQQGLGLGQRQQLELGPKAAHTESAWAERLPRALAFLGAHWPAKQPHSQQPQSTPPPAKRSKPAAEPTKGKGKAAKAKPAPQPGRWLDRDCNAALNMQRIGESRWRPLELCYWPDQGALPAKGKEYPGLGYKRLRDKPPKAQEQQQQPAEAQ
ncbi:hypothetical protein QJQ45_011012 [Haematococcus lacustris]|nr:hypothetical protein QJQ45_011012 [Haematococcus lacustris]